MTGGKTFDTNLGRCSSAGGGSPGARTVYRVFQMKSTGSGGRVGAGGSQAARWQGSHRAVGVPGWCRVRGHDESPDGFIPISMTGGHGCPSLGGAYRRPDESSPGGEESFGGAQAADARAVSGGPLKVTGSATASNRQLQLLNTARAACRDWTCAAERYAQGTASGRCAENTVHSLDV